MGDELKPVPHWMEELSQSQMDAAFGLLARAEKAEAEVERLTRERDDARTMAESRRESADMAWKKKDEERQARLAAEASNRTLREALEEAEHCLVPATKKLVEIGFWPHAPYARGAVRAALAQPADDSALRALVTRACEAQREACVDVFPVSHVARLALVATPLITLDDVLGKAGE